jgi:multidrug efflux system membrane fusion protein
MTRFVAVLPCLLLAACRHQEAKIEQPVTPVRVTAVEQYRPKTGGRYSASILPGRQVSLAFRVSGLVASVNRMGGRNLEPGDIVAAGTVLARLREEDYRIATAQSQSQVDATRQSEAAAKAQLAQAEASRAKAQADFNRARTLFDSQSLTRPDFDSAKAQLDVATAQVDAARAQLASASAQIRNAEAGAATARLAHGDTALVAPFAATVVQRNVDIGMLAGPSQPSFTLADIGFVKAAFGVPDTVVGQLRPGVAIDVEVDALPGREFRGTVSAIAGVADAETRLFQVEVTLANPKLVLKPGMVAALRLGDTAAAPPVPVVPLSAVIRDRENPSKFAVMVVENKTARMRPVALGQTFGDVLAVSGLQPGELVIRAGATLVSHGETVEVIP